MKSKKVLIVDDDAEFAGLLGQWLGKYGIDSEVSGSSEEGLEKARTIGPAVIVMDIMMPGIHGIEAVKQLRRDPATAKTPVIMLSAAPKDKLEMQAAELEAEFIHKGVPPDVLVQSIKRRLSSAA